MARIIKVKNTQVDTGSWVGQDIPAGNYFTIPEEYVLNWKNDPQVFTDIGNEKLLVNDGNVDFTNPVQGYAWLSQGLFPLSDLDKTKIAVHSSPKPTAIAKPIYAVWTGAGDIVGDGKVGNDDIIELVLSPGTAIATKDIKFDSANGACWIHEAYIRWEDGGPGDYITSFVMAPATPVQTVASLSMVIENNWLKPVTSGATHGFADPTKIYLVPRTFSNDGWWNYDGVSLTPNLAGSGNHHISDIERSVHRFVNKIPTRGTVYDYVILTSDETSMLPKGYFIRIEAHNVSDTAWWATVIIEMYREKTS